MYSDFGICFQEFETLAARLITMEVKTTLLLLLTVLSPQPATNQMPATDRFWKAMYICVATCEQEMIRCIRKHYCAGVQPGSSTPRHCSTNHIDCINKCKITYKKLTIN
ncbi:hypothetical protein LSAT2_012738 [Lamellibrachia satsuma]|nr:hypothetical protein LSAT2_012738 [Lamellibrachia satsuma]